MSSSWHVPPLAFNPARRGSPETPVQHSLAPAFPSTPPIWHPLALVSCTHLLRQPALASAFSQLTDQKPKQDMVRLQSSSVAMSMRTCEQASSPSILSHAGV